MSEVEQEYNRLQALWWEQVRAITGARVVSKAYAKKIALAQVSRSLVHADSARLRQLFDYACRLRGLDPELKLAGKKQGFAARGRRVEIFPVFAAEMIRVTKAMIKRREATHQKRMNTMKQNRRDLWALKNPG